MPRRTTSSRGERRQSRRTQRTNLNTNSDNGSSRNSHRHRTRHRLRNDATLPNEPVASSSIRVSYNSRCFRRNRTEGPRDMTVFSCEVYLPLNPSDPSSITFCDERVRNVSSRRSSNGNGRYHLRSREQHESNNLRAIVINPLGRSTQVALRARSESREGRRRRRSRDHSEPRETHSRPRRATLRRRSHSHGSRRRQRDRPQREQHNARVTIRDVRIPRERSNSSDSYDRLRRQLRGDRPTSPIVSLVRHPVDEVERVITRQSTRTLERNLILESGSTSHPRTRQTSGIRHVTVDAGSGPHHRTRQATSASSARTTRLVQIAQSRISHTDVNTSDSEIAEYDRQQARKRRRRGSNSNSNRRRRRVPFHSHVSSSSSMDEDAHRFRGFNNVVRPPPYSSFSFDSDSDFSVDRPFHTGPFAMLTERFSDSSDMDVYPRSGRAAPEPMSPESVYRRDRLRGMFLNSPLMIYSRRAAAGNAAQGAENQQRRYDTDESHDSEPTSAGEHDTCAICLRTLRAELIASPSCCDHNFCPRCIQRWSETSSTCPVDRRRFMEIIVRNRRTGDNVDVLEAVHRNQFDFITEVFSNLRGPPPQLQDSICSECNTAIPENDVITCDVCGNTYHNECVYPPLEEIPGFWVCFTCANEPHPDIDDDTNFVFRDFSNMLYRMRRSPIATRSSTRLQENERNRTGNGAGVPRRETRIHSPDFQHEGSDSSSAASIEDIPIDYDLVQEMMNNTSDLNRSPLDRYITNNYNRRPLSVTNDSIRAKIGLQSIRQMEIVADGETAIMRHVDDLWRGEDVAVSDSEVSLVMPSTERRVSPATTQIPDLSVVNAFILMESLLSLMSTIKPNLTNPDINCNVVPLFPSNKQSYDARYSTLNRPTSDNGNSGGYSSNSSALGSFNPSIRPGFSNILGNNTSADLTPFRASSPIRFRMNPPRTAWRRQMNQQQVAPLTRPPTPPALLKSPEADDDTNMLTDMPALLPPPALPALLLCSTSSSDDDEESSMPVFKPIGAPKKSDIYDPTEPNEDSTDDEVETENKDYVPSYMTSPSYGDGNASYGPHLPMPEPPPVPSGIISLSTSEDEEEEDGKNENFSCPNLHWYSSKIKDKSASNPQLDLESIPLPIPIPEDKNSSEENSEVSKETDVIEDGVAECDKEEEHLENGEEEEEKMSRLRKFLIVGLGDGKRPDTIADDTDSCVSEDVDEVQVEKKSKDEEDEEQLEKKSEHVEETPGVTLQENVNDEEGPVNELIKENEKTVEEEIPTLEKVVDDQSSEIETDVDKIEDILETVEDVVEENDVDQTSNSLDKVCLNMDDNMNDLEDKMITLDEVTETERDEDEQEGNAKSDRYSESPFRDSEPSDNEQKKKIEKKKKKKKKKKTDKNELVKKSKKKKHNGLSESLENDERKKDRISWKRLTKNTKDRNYRDGKEGKNVAELSGKKEIENEKTKKKRKELERYNVRLVVNDNNNKKDEFGRDLTPGRSRSKSLKSRPSYSSRSKSPKLVKRRSRSRTKGSDKKGKSKESYNSNERITSKSRIRSRDRSKSKGKYGKRSNERIASSERRIGDGSLHKKDNNVRAESPRIKGRKKMHRRSSSIDGYPLRSISKSPKKKVNKRSPSVDRYPMRSLSRSPRKKITKRSPSIDRYPLKSLSRSPRRKTHKRSPSLGTYPLRSLSRSPRRKIHKRSPSVGNYPLRSLSRSPGSPPYYAKSGRSIAPPRIFPPQTDTLKNLTVVIPNDDLSKKKKSRKRKDTRHKKKKKLPTTPHKAVFATGDNIVVSVNFSSKEKGVEYSKQVKRKRISDEPRLTVEKKKKIPNVSKEVLNAKPVAIIDLNSSPFREMQGQEVITLTDSGDEEEEEGTKTAPEEESANEEKKDEIDFMAGPKTPPEPSSLFSASLQVRPNSTFNQDDVDDSRKGPNTPPESSPEHASSPNAAAMYDPFEPTKSPQTPEPEVKGSPIPEPHQTEIDMFAEDTKEETFANEGSDDDSPKLVIDESKHDDAKKEDDDDVIVVAEENTPAPQTQSSSNTLVIDLSSLGDNFVPKSSMPLIKTSQGKYEIVNSNKSPDKPITVVISQQAQPVKPQPQQVVVTPTRQIPFTPSSVQIPGLSSKLPENTRSLFSHQWAMPSTTTNSILSVAPFTSPETVPMDLEDRMDDDDDDDGASPYSPASNEGDDIFEPPSESPRSQEESRILTDVLKPRQNNDLFDLLKKTQKHDTFGQIDRTSTTKLAAKVLPKAKVFALSPVPNADVDLKQDEDQLKILDEVPNSAVELEVKEKFLKKLHRQERVVEEVKMALKPHYARKHISKEDYKFILKKAVPKICHNKSGDINPVKIHGLVEAYVKKIRHGKKKPHNPSSAFSANTSADKPFKRAKSLWE